jgi:outer membrane protein assembly factor BamE (lipoprotein component of BamABCDE complex)
MKRTFFKILSVLLISILLILTFLMGKITLSEGKHLLDPYIDTYFAVDYTPEKFNLIKSGMTFDEVKMIIGAPLYKSPESNNSTKMNYYYTADGKLLGKAREQERQDYDDCAWYRSTVTFDTNNVVIDIDKGWSFD